MSNVSKKDIQNPSIICSIYICQGCSEAGDNHSCFQVRDVVHPVQ